MDLADLQIRNAIDPPRTHDRGMHPWLGRKVRVRVRVEYESYGTVWVDAEARKYATEGAAVVLLPRRHRRRESVWLAHEDIDWGDHGQPPPTPPSTEVTPRDPDALGSWWSRQLAWNATPPKDPDAVPTRDPIDVEVRVDWSRDGVEWVAGTATRWTGDVVYVELAPDVRPRSRWAGVWVAPSDVRRR